MCATRNVRAQKRKNSVLTTCPVNIAAALEATTGAVDSPDSVTVHNTRLPDDSRKHAHKVLILESC